MYFTATQLAVFIFFPLIICTTLHTRDNSPRKFREKIFQIKMFCARNLALSPGGPRQVFVYRFIVRIRAVQYTYVGTCTCELHTPIEYKPIGTLYRVHTYVISSSAVHENKQGNIERRTKFKLVKNTCSVKGRWWKLENIRENTQGMCTRTYINSRTC